MGRIPDYTALFLKRTEEGRFHPPKTAHRIPNGQIVVGAFKPESAIPIGKDLMERIEQYNIHAQAEKEKREFGTRWRSLQENYEIFLNEVVPHYTLSFEEQRLADLLLKQEGFTPSDISKQQLDIYRKSVLFHHGMLDDLLKNLRMNVNPDGAGHEVYRKVAPRHERPEERRARAISQVFSDKTFVPWEASYAAGVLGEKYFP